MYNSPNLIVHIHFITKYYKEKYLNISSHYILDRIFLYMQSFPTNQFLKRKIKINFYLFLINLKTFFILFVEHFNKNTLRVKLIIYLLYLLSYKNFKNKQEEKLGIYE